MHKKLLSTLLLSSALFGSDGYEVYKRICSTCHVEMMGKSEALKNLSKLKAPPMVEVSNRIKENIIIKDEEEEIHRHLFVLFVKDYIVNPKLDNSMCNVGALEKFGTMPSLKGKISEKERQAVAEWLYDRYKSVKFN